ncbi:HD domain-containing protein [Caloranaerobacter sp. DY30410]|uniref:HD domain-containing protein n=1 Tax=Caloranaerobacter sp. DY30410 TaxID=3238305 RepID=UPI003D055CF0
MLLLEMKDLSDEDRDLPIRWNIMYMYTSSQIAKILALKRGINPEIAGIAAALHDINIVKTKEHKNHAKAAGRYVYEIISDNPFVEILKDVDSLDRYLHGVKTEGLYCKRCIKILKEIGIKDVL